MAQIRVPTVQSLVDLEYRVAVLEGALRWLLSNAYLTEPISEEELARIYWEAADTIREKHPDAEIDYGELSPDQESLFPK